MRDYLDSRVTSLSWGPPPPCKQTLTESLFVEVCALQFVKMARKCPMGMCAVVHCKIERFPFNPKFRTFPLLHQLERTISVCSHPNIREQL